MLDVALKEWAVICDLLTEGRQVILLRKGGIAEDDGPGRFRLEHEHFALYPAWEHQRQEGIKPALQDRVETFGREPDDLPIRGYADVARIWSIPSRQAFDQLDDLHAWSTSQIDMRFQYKPERPLYLLALRVYTWPNPKWISSDRTYWGCRSWVPLRPEHHLDETGAAPALPERELDAMVDRIERTLG